MKRAHGFTLIELAISVAIIGLLLGMLMVPLNAQIDQQRTSDTNKELKLITEAMLGFAVANGRLPCPAVATTPSTTAGAGLENTAACAGATSAVGGVVPWATLGVPETDAWGHRFTYRVTREFANDPTGGMQSTFALTDIGNIDVLAAGGAVVVADDMAAAIVSHGRNGAGAFRTDGNQVLPVTGDEAENADGDNNFISKIPDPAFDDLVAWISPNVLKSRMVAGNRLP